MSQPGRGRARGRATAQSDQQQQRAPRPGPQQQQQQQQQPRPVWGPSARQEQQPRPPGAGGQGAIPRQPQPPAVPAGRVTTRVESAHARPGTARSNDGVIVSGGDGGGDQSRGSMMRGRRHAPGVVIVTKPKNLESKKGSTGNVVQLSANFFKVLKKPNWALFQYRVDFSPEEDRTGAKKRMFREACAKILPSFIFDGTVCYTIARLNPLPMELFVTSPDGESQTRITIKLVGEIDVNDYQYLQIYNMILRKCVKAMKLQLIGREYFDPENRIFIHEHKLEVWPGYRTSIRQHEQDIMLTCDLAFKIMRMDTVLTLLMDCAAEDRQNFKKLFASRIIGSTVLTVYNNQMYRIDDVDFHTTPASTFQKADGTTISYLAYYKGRYQITIQNETQPLLVSKAKARELRAGQSETVLLVPELCRMTGLTDQMRANFHMMKALGDHTRIGPAVRIDRLLGFSKRMTSLPEVRQELEKWNLGFSQNIVEFAGRTLNPEKIYFGGKKPPFLGNRDADWTREFRDREMFVAGRMDSWAVIYPKRCAPSLDSFLQMIHRASSGMRWNLPKPQRFEIQDDRPATYLPTLDRAIQTQPSLIMCVVSNNKADRYSAIKKKTYVDKAVPTQVMVARNLDSKGAMSIATKVVIQMNCKVGGAPWAVEMPLSGLMVVGYDVCHDTQNRSISFGAMVASLDKACSRYFSTVTAHKSGEELSNDLAIQIIKACRTYQEINHQLPTKIVVYRDGVGDGQLPYVVEHEVNLIKQKLHENLYPNGSLNMAFIIVVKRMNTKIFANASNPSPGTIVDDCITLPERFDFYVVSQCAKQGTVAPTAYNVIENTSGLGPDHLQRLTYKLCHMYFNWSGTVRVPAPCQYAHKLAFLVGQHLHRQPHDNLNGTLYYL